MGLSGQRHFLTGYLVGIAITGPKSTWTITSSATCTTKNIVYCITCTKCGKLYIGETKRMLRERFREHLRDIRISNMVSPVAQHFNSRDHNIDDITVSCIFICSSEAQRKEMEMKIIKKLGTLDPLGLNIDFSYNVWFAWCIVHKHCYADFPSHMYIYINF